MAPYKQVHADLVGVGDARPYGVVGPRPDNATHAYQGQNGVGVPYVSDVPWDPPYEERLQCSSLRKDGEPCKGKALPGKERCSSHEDG